VRANATRDAMSDCASSLQLQDTVRSSLRSENNAQALHKLVEDHRADAVGTQLILQQLRTLVEKVAMEQQTTAAEQKSTAAMVVAEQRSTAAMAVAEQRSTAAMAVAEQRSIATMATFEMRIYLGAMVTLLLTASAFFFYYPQRAVAVLKAPT